MSLIIDCDRCTATTALRVIKMTTSAFRTNTRRIDDSTETPDQAHLVERFLNCKATLRRQFVLWVSPNKPACRPPKTTWWRDNATSAADVFKIALVRLCVSTTDCDQLFGGEAPSASAKSSCCRASSGRTYARAISCSSMNQALSRDQRRRFRLDLLSERPLARRRAAIAASP